MATTVEEPRVQLASVQRLFTVDEYYAMARAGVFAENERVELIEGWVVTMSPIGTPHTWCVHRLNYTFAARRDVFISIQCPIRLDEGTMPEPDVAVLRADAPQDRTPVPEDILLLVEVAESSLEYDRDVKAPLYARAGIPEYWLVDLGRARIAAYRDPSPQGYRSIQFFVRGEQLSPRFAPDFTVEVDGILGAVQPQV